MLSGALPLEGVGFVIREMYEHGVVHMEHQPFFLAPPPGVTPGIAHDDVLRLPPPGKKPQKMDGNIAQTCAEIVKAGHGKPVHTKAVGEGMVKAGFARSSTGGALQRAMNQGLIKRAGMALYLPAKANGKAQNKAPKGGSESQHAIVAKTIERAYPKWVTRAKLLKVFAKYGFRPESSSVAVSKLKGEGKVIYGESDKGASYQWVPEEKRQTEPENPPADSQ